MIMTLNNINCICGNESVERYSKQCYEVTPGGETVKSNNDLLFGRCGACGVIRQQRLPYDSDKYDDYYKKYQPTNEQYKTKNYDHDRMLASTRCDKYGIMSSVDSMKILDVGSGSGAFVDECRNRGMESFGCEISEYNYSVNDEFIYNKSFEDVFFPTDHFDMITCHDVLEHVIDPIRFVNELFRVLKQEGECIVDFPRFFHDAGEHHWKEEHVWFFTQEQLEKLFKDAGFQINKVTFPIESKILFFMVKPEQNRVKILYPPGMGDSYWSIVKTKAFLKREELGLPDIHIACNKEKEFNGHKRAFPLIEMYPFLNASWITHSPDRDNLKPLWLEAYRDKGRTIFKNICDCDYFISYNGNLAHGIQLENLDPDLECNWNPDMFVSLEQEKFKNKFIESLNNKRYIVFYFIFHGTYRNWTMEFPVDKVARTIRKVSNATNCAPVLVGAKWDEKDNLQCYVSQQVPDIIDMRGKTTVEQLFGLMKGSQLVIGYPSGLTIMSASLGIKTLTIWNDYYNKDFAWYSCPPSVREKTYFIMNTKNLKPIDIVNKVSSILC